MTLRVGITIEGDARSVAAAARQTERSLAQMSQRGLGPAQRQSRQLTAQTAILRRGMTRTAGVARSFAASLGLGTAVGLAAAMNETIQLGRSFDRSFTRINTLVGISKTQTGAWREELLKLGPAAGKAPEELAQALFFITSAGSRGRDALEDLRAAAEGSAIGLGDTAVVADAATSAVNAYGRSNLNARDAVAVLFGAVREGKADAAAIAPALGRVIPIAAEMGVEFNEVGASIAAMTKLGLDGAGAVTSLRAILAGILKPSEQARDILEAVGLSAQGLRDKIRQDGLLATLQLLRRELGDDEEALGRLFESQEAATGFLALLGKNADETRRIFAALATVTGKDLTKAFDEASQSADQRLSKATARVNARFTELGNLTLPYIADGVEHLVDRFDRGIGIAASLGRVVKSALEGSDVAAAKAALHMSIFGDKIREAGAEARALKSDLDRAALAAAAVNRGGKSDREDAPDKPKIDLDALEETKARREAVADLIEDLRFEARISSLGNTERELELNLRDALAVGTRAQQQEIRKLTGAIQAGRARDLVEEMEFELEILKLSNAERRVEIALRNSGAVASQAQKDQLTALAEQYERNREATERWKESARAAADIALGALRNLAEGGKVSLKSLALSAFQTFADIAQRAASDGLTNLLSQGLSSAFSGFGFSTSTSSGSGSSGFLANAKGNVFRGGRLVAFERGGVFNQPHMFPLADGGTGVFAEAGPEAIMPLGRDASGRLGVRASGGGGGLVINSSPVFSSDISPEGRAWVKGQIEASEARMTALVKQSHVAAMRRRSDAFLRVSG